MFCNSLTSSGNNCKNSKNCHLHSENQNHHECSICLSSVRKTRGVKELICGHMFHNRCLNSWKETGGTTCPMCRKTFDETKYKVTISIQNNQNQNQVTTISSTMGSVTPFLDDIGYFTELTVSLDSNRDLGGFLENLNIRLADLDPSIFNTE